MTDELYMSRALALARKGLYTTDPNPRVGCVLVKDGKIVGEGWHEEVGAAHAETNALADAGARARGASAYVTLEPCCHVGHTGPCTQALIEAGVVRVVAAMRDPNPLVCGRGLDELESTGILVQVGVLEAPARSLNPGFCSRMINNRPYVRCKSAMSLDARTAMASGESRWITSPDARRDVQRLRARSSAIMTGIGTVLADDPSLTVRPEEMGLVPVPSAEHLRQPLRIVVDSNFRTPPDAKLFKHEGKTLIAGAIPISHANGLETTGAELVSLGANNGRTDLRALLTLLAKRRVNEVLVESGPTLAGAMLQAGLIDELVVYVAPKIMGDTARGLLSLPGLDRLDAAIEVDIIDVRAIGRDWRLTAVPRTSQFN